MHAYTPAPVKRTPGIAASLVLVMALLLGFWSGTAAAQDDEPGFRGTLTATPEEGDRFPVEGVRVVLTADGAEVGEATSGADGTWFIAAEAGSYNVAVDTSTFAEGISLKDPEATSRDLELSPGQSRNVLFALIEGEGGAAPNVKSDLERIPGLVKDGLIFGLIIAMSSIGLSLIFGTTGLTNFAHGELVTFGAVTALGLNKAGLHILLAGLIAVPLTAAVGAGNEVGLWRPLRRRGSGLIAMLVISIGLSILARYLVLYFVGGRRETYNQFALQTDGYDLLGFRIVNREIWIIIISMTVLLAVAFAVNKTKTGKAMRAVADNRDLAESSGIDVERVILTIWIAGAGLAGLGGILFGLNQGVSWNMGFELLLLMFAAVTLGGLGTAYGPLLGSLVVGLFINLSTLIVSSEIKNVGALLILGVILLVRPQGILGRGERIG